MGVEISIDKERVNEMANSKKLKEALAKVDRSKSYTLKEAISLVTNQPLSNSTKRSTGGALGVDPRHADQMVRGAVVLPNGSARMYAFLSLPRVKKRRKPVTQAPITSAQKTWSPKSRKDGSISIRPSLLLI